MLLHGEFLESKEYKEYQLLTLDAKSHNTDSEGLTYSTSVWQKVTQVRDTLQAHDKLVDHTKATFGKKIINLQGQLEGQIEFDEKIRYIDYLKEQKEKQAADRRKPTQPLQPSCVTPVPPSTVNPYTNYSSIRGWTSGYYNHYSYCS